MKYRFICFLPINIGKWVFNVGPVDQWNGLDFMEAVLDWSILPENCYGKLYVEMRNGGSIRDKPIMVRLAYSQMPELHGELPARHGKRFPIEGSEIVYEGISSRWQLLESEWFKLPHVDNVSCLWVQSKAEKGSQCGVAIANVAVVERLDAE